MPLSQRPDNSAIETQAASAPRLDQPSREVQLGNAAKVRAAEQADRFNENPDAALQSVERDENPQRLAELETWATANLPNCKPTEIAALALQQMEQEALADGFADFQITDEAPDDLREDVMLLSEQLVKQERNKQTQAEISEGVPAKVPAEAGKKSQLLKNEQVLTDKNRELSVENPKLKTKNNGRLTQEAKGVERNETAQAELDALQTEFLEIKSDIGTEAALRQILTKATIPEAQQHIRAVLRTISLLRTALPNKDAALTNLLNTAPINLGAASVAASFDSVLSAAETSPDFTPADVATMRQIVDKQEIYVRTGTQVQTELSQTQTDENGQTVPTHPETDPFKFRLNVIGFAEPNGTQKLRATTVHGERVTLDITGWSGADIGRASELLQLWAMTENEGQTDYLTSLTKLKWSGTAKIDPFKLQYAAQVVIAILGGGEGHDGDIFDGKEALGMIRWQARLTNQKGDTLRGNRDADRTDDVLVDLGIRDKDENLDLDALKAFGEYSRDNWNVAADFEGVQAHIIKAGRSGSEK